MEITDKQWEDLMNKVNGFEAQIEELKTKNTTLETKNGEYETKLAEWQTKLNDQQKTIDTLAKSQSGSQKETKPKAEHKSVRYDPIQDKLIYDE